MKILAGAVVRQHPDILAAHLKTMKWQVLRDEHRVDLVYVNDLDPDDINYARARDILLDDPSIITYSTDIKERPAGAEYEVGEDTHHWNVATFQYLAAAKQELLDYAVKRGYDAVWLVDTDLLCDPHTLQALIDVDQPITSSVFWTQWSPELPYLPQVWQHHPYELDSIKVPQHEFIKRLSHRDILSVGGLGACTLIRTEVLDRVRYWPFLDGLPEGGMWQGEDRHFSVRANRAHIPLTACAWSDIYHVYRHSYISGIPAALADLEARSLPAANIGDYVSFTIEDLETAGLADHKLRMRGRLGQIDMLPEIEIDLQNLSPGQDCITRVSFPLWYEIPELRGQTRLFRLTLLAVKPYLPPIGLPTASSEFDERYYTPAQIRLMRNSRVRSNEDNHAANDNASGRDGDPS